MEAVRKKEYGCTHRYIQSWPDYGTEVIDYDYTNNDCNRLRLHNKVIVIKIIITMHISQMRMQY